MCCQPNGCEDQHANAAIVTAPTVKLVVRVSGATCAGAQRGLTTCCFSCSLLLALLVMFSCFARFACLHSRQQCSSQAGRQQCSRAAWQRQARFHGFSFAQHAIAQVPGQQLPGGVGEAAAAAAELARLWTAKAHDFCIHATSPNLYFSSACHYSDSAFACRSSQPSTRQLTMRDHFPHSDPHCHHHYHHCWCCCCYQGCFPCFSGFLCGFLVAL